MPEVDNRAADDREQERIQGALRCRCAREERLRVLNDQTDENADDRETGKRCDDVHRIDS